MCKGDFRAIAELITVFNDLCLNVPEQHRSGEQQLHDAEWWGQPNGPFTDPAADYRAQPRHRPAVFFSPERLRGLAVAATAERHVLRCAHHPHS